MKLHSKGKQYSVYFMYTLLISKMLSPTLQIKAWCVHKVNDKCWENTTKIPDDVDVDNCLQPLI